MSYTRRRGVSRRGLRSADKKRCARLRRNEGTPRVPEIPHYVRDDAYFFDVSSPRSAAGGRGLTKDRNNWCRTQNVAIEEYKSETVLSAPRLPYREPHQPSGTYFVLINTNGVIINKKVIRTK